MIEEPKYGKYGEVSFDKDGLPQCHICGGHFKRVATHVRQAHQLSAREYKELHGLNVSKGIISADSAQLSRDRVEENFHVINNNLIVRGRSTRYKKGDKGRTKDQLSYQEKMRLQLWAPTNIPLEDRQKLSSTLGKSGLGNKARWGNR